MKTTKVAQVQVLSWAITGMDMKVRQIVTLCVHIIIMMAKSYGRSSTAVQPENIFNTFVTEYSARKI